MNGDGFSFNNSNNRNSYYLKKRATTNNDKMNGNFFINCTPPRFQSSQVKAYKAKQNKKEFQPTQQKQAQAQKREYKSQPINNSKSKCFNAACIECNCRWIWMNAKSLNVLRCVYFSVDRYRNDREFYCRFDPTINLGFIRYAKFQLSPSHFCYNRFQNILVLGECDFSLTASLVCLFGGNGSNIVSTCWYRYHQQWCRNIYHSVGAEKFSEFEANKKFCEHNGVECVFNVDAKKLNQSIDRWNRRRMCGIDVVLMTLPRIYDKEGRWSTEEYFKKNGELIRGVLESAKEYLSIYGEIHIMAYMNQFKNWRIDGILAELNLEKACCATLDEYSLDHLFHGYKPRDSHGNFVNLKDWYFEFFAIRPKIAKPNVITMKMKKRKVPRWQKFKSDFYPLRVVRLKDVDSKQAIGEAPNPFQGRLKEFKCGKKRKTYFLHKVYDSVISEEKEIKIEEISKKNEFGDNVLLFASKDLNKHITEYYKEKDPKRNEKFKQQRMPPRFNQSNYNNANRQMTNYVL